MKFIPDNMEIQIVRSASYSSLGQSRNCKIPWLGLAELNMAQILCFRVFRPYSPVPHSFTLILRPSGSIQRAGAGIWNSILSGLAHIVSFEISDNVGFKPENYL